MFEEEKPLEERSKNLILFFFLNEHHAAGVQTFFTDGSI
jgi:hypothetical protein